MNPSFEQAIVMQVTCLLVMLVFVVSGYAVAAVLSAIAVVLALVLVLGCRDRG